MPFRSDARGGLAGKHFPWGDEPPDKACANYLASGVGETTRVGSYPANGYGLFDVAGNVWEYTADEWAAYTSSAQVNPVAGGSRRLQGQPPAGGRARFRGLPLRAFGVRPKAVTRGASSHRRFGETTGNTGVVGVKLNGA